MPGWAKGKGQPKWHEVVFDMWKGMWERVYTHINYFGKTIQPKYKYLSEYVDDFQKLENFDLFKENPHGWSIDKDIKGGTHIGYYFEYLSLTTRSDNSKNRADRDGYSQLHTKDARAKASKNKMKSIIGIPTVKGSIIIVDSVNNVRDKDFDPSAVSKCCKGKNDHKYKKYKWFYIKYKHNKTYRRV